MGDSSFLKHFFDCLKENENRSAGPTIFILVWLLMVVSCNAPAFFKCMRELVMIIRNNKPGENQDTRDHTHAWPTGSRTSAGFKLALVIVVFTSGVVFPCVFIPLICYDSYVAE